MIYFNLPTVGVKAVQSESVAKAQMGDETLGE